MHKVRERGIQVPKKQYIFGKFSPIFCILSPIFCKLSLSLCKLSPFFEKHPDFFRAADSYGIYSLAAGN